MATDGFAVVPRAVLRQAGLSGYAKLVYALLAARIDASGECYPSVALLASESGWSKPTVIKAIDELVRVGLVERRHGRFHNSYAVATDSTSFTPTATESTEMDSTTLNPRGRIQSPLPTDSTSFTDGFNHVERNDTHLTIPTERETTGEAESPEGCTSLRGVQGGKADAESLVAVVPRRTVARRRELPPGGVGAGAASRGVARGDSAPVLDGRRGPVPGTAEPAPEQRAEVRRRAVLSPGAAEIVAYWRERKGAHCKPRWAPNPEQTERLEHAVARYGVDFMRDRVRWAAEVEAEFIGMLRGADKFAKTQAVEQETAETGRTNGHAIPVTASRIEGGRTLIPKEPGVYQHGVRCDCGEVYSRMRPDCPRCAQRQTELTKVTA